MTDHPLSIMERLQRFAEQLKSSTLLLLATSLFVLDLMIPDPLAFVVDIILGLVTVLIARWQGRRKEPAPKPPPKDVTPPGGETD